MEEMNKDLVIACFCIGVYTGALSLSAFMDHVAPPVVQNSPIVGRMTCTDEKNRLVSAKSPAARVCIVREGR